MCVLFPGSRARGLLFFYPAARLRFRTGGGCGRKAAMRIPYRRFFRYLWLTPKILPFGIIKPALASALAYHYLCPQKRI